MDKLEHYHDLFGRELTEVDPDTELIIGYEEERQARRFIFIPSESICPLAVRQALGSSFTDIYAEGYPPLRMTREEEEKLLDFSHQLAHYRRYGDRRFYKGADYVNFIECLAQRRCAQAFATADVPADEIQVNVQPLSGAAANLAVYDAFLKVGDTFMGMDLFQGGHLTHGSEYNISGKRYKVVSYGVNPKTERLDYEAIRALALQHRPKLIVAGFTSYPWMPDWHKFREIADACGALLMADIAHTAGLVAAGVLPSPVGIADIVTFTTHKTLCGPRGAVILTTDEEKAKLVDAAVFPGAQGGPHTNKFAAMAVAFKIAQTEPFRKLQARILENAQALAAGLVKRGLKVAYGGTDTHMCLLDLRGVKTPNGQPLRGEIAVRIMELCGLVANKNTLPGDPSTALASGVRLGAPWLTQRGMGTAEMDKLADLIHQIVTQIAPFQYIGLRGELPRGKMPFEALEQIKQEVAALAEETLAETASKGSGYPHYQAKIESASASDPGLFEVRGERARPFLQEVVTVNLADLQAGEARRALMLDIDGNLLADAALWRFPADEPGTDRYLLRARPEAKARVAAWLRDLSDGYVLFDRQDVLAKVEGPVIVEEVAPCDQQYLPEEANVALDELASALTLTEPLPAATLLRDYPELFDLSKPYFIGQSACRAGVSPALQAEGSGQRPDLRFNWVEPENPPLKRTPLYEEHRRLTRKIIPFAGWEMPVWYSSVAEEHQTVRQAAGLFDVAHMGVLEVAGEHAADLLDFVGTNYTRWLGDGQSCYGYLMDPAGHVIDDIMVYRRRWDRYLLVVNAANADKDWAWLNAVNSGEAQLEHNVRLPAPAILRDLKDPATGADQRVDLALQGPRSLAILQSLTDDARLKRRLARIRRTELGEMALSGIPLIIARTGYTGEESGYELFVHPDQAATLWRLLLERGASFGLRPCGLAARDSTRIEAGLPLYGHELAGEQDIAPCETGFSAYIKFHKPYFIGRARCITQESGKKMETARFRVDRAGARALHPHDPVVNRNGGHIGWVTSCTLIGGVQMGMAYIEKRYNVPGTPISVFPLPGAERSEQKPLGALHPGDRVTLPEGATVLTRFPQAEEKAAWGATIKPPTAGQE
jgi:glycine hydroxymethyltransferase